MPKVTVVMANYNAEQFIAESIKSVINQTFDDWELIVVDDCSTDDSIRVVEAFDDARVKLLKNDFNMGPHLSRNRAFEIAEGDYIAILDSDDIMLKNKLRKQVKYLETHRDCDILHTAVYYFGEKRGLSFVRVGDKSIKRTLFIGCPICNSTVMWRRSLNLKYDEEFSRAEDYNMWLKNMDKKFHGMNTPLIKRRIHKEQISFGYGLTQQLSDKVNGDTIRKYFPELSQDDISLFERGRVGVLDNDELLKLDNLLYTMVQNAKNDFLMYIGINKAFSHMLIKCMQRSVGNINVVPRGTIYGKRYGFCLLDRILYRFAKFRAR